MPALLSSLACGFIFGLGLLISGMVDPAKVLGFLDIFGAWDPSLAVVMAAALVVSGIGYALARRLGRPLLAPRSAWPDRTDIDGPLAIGSLLFGIGWGLVGLCPGPALTDLATLAPPVIAFVAAMGAGIALHYAWSKRRTAALTRRQDELAADG